MPKNHPFFSIIYVNYKSAHYLESALKSLISQEEKEIFEIIIVNNDKEERDLIEKLGQEFSCITLQNTSNKGFGSGVNQGVQAASGKWIGLINPDTLWPKSQLQVLQGKIKEKNAVIGLRLLDKDGQEERFGCGRKITLLQLFFNHLPPILSLGRKPVGWLSGGALFFQKALWAELKGFDEKYFLYYEDVDFCERARLAGRNIEQEPLFSIVHFGGKSHSSKKQQKKHYRESQIYYFEKFRPWYEQKILKLLHLFLS
ncbi:MAG: glycosyltransferase [Candidatus Moranbacteria bacterium]|nr:glycosyltransferase [Candidatus Moranbacteria bacterium]